MRALRIRGMWNEMAGKLKQQFAGLSDDEVLFRIGKEEELLGKLQQKTGTTGARVRTGMREGEDGAAS